MRRSSDELDAMQNQMPLRRATLRSGEVRVTQVGVREVRRFWALGASGRRHLIIETASLHDVRTHDDPNAAPLEGLHSLRTSEGLAVNHLPDGKYQIAQTGEVLTRE